MKQTTDSKFRMCYKAEKHINILLQEAQNLHPLTTLIDTIRRLVTATG